MATSLSIRPESRTHALARSHPTPGILLATANSRLQGEMWALLRSWEHPVDIVADHYALLRALERPESAPIVILDTDLPGLRGIALLHQLQLQSTRRGSWTILLTGAPHPGEGGDNIAAQCTGVDDVLAQPVDELELRVSLRAASRVQARYAEMAEALEAAGKSGTPREVNARSVSALTTRLGEEPARFTRIKP
jgi:DNA-binding response OmpR family regulator